MATWNTTSKISARMSKIVCKGSSIEKTIAKQLRKKGFKYRSQYDIIGKPDFVLPKEKVAIFCDSHFWHGYNWKVRQYDHKSNADQWRKKILANMKRDKKVNKMLRKAGWKVIRFWEHQITKSSEKCILKVQKLIGGNVEG